MRIWGTHWFCNYIFNTQYFTYSSYRPVRAVCEVLGVKDIVAKSMGTSNAHNVIRATMKALLKQNSPKQISAIRNKKISEIVEKRG